MISKDTLKDYQDMLSNATEEELAIVLNIKVESVQRYIRLMNEMLQKPKKKVLFMDTETSPLINYNWGLFKQNVSINQIIDTWYFISWSAKWLNDDTIYSDVQTSEEALNKDDSRITKSLWEMLDEADIVVAHNAPFDLQRANTRFIYNGLSLPSSYRTIDTLSVLRKVFAFPSNKLDFIAQQLGFGSKIKTDFSLWDGCIKGHESSLYKMEEYNRMDVEILEKLYKEIRRFIPLHPPIYQPTENTCPICGSDNVVNDGLYRTNLNEYPAYRCESCGTVLKERNKSNKELVTFR